MLPLTNALRSRICPIAPHLLVSKSAFNAFPVLARRHVLSSRYHLVAGQAAATRHQLLGGVNVKWSGWFRRSFNGIAKATTASHADDQKKEVSSEKPFRRLLSLAHPERLVIGASVVCLCVSSAVTMSVPYCIGKILDIIFTDSFMAEKLSTFCMAMVAVFVVGSAANFGRIYLMNGACK